MRDNPLFLVVAASVLAVVVVLMFGLGSMARGGDFNRRNGNRLMRWRIILQAVAIVVILLFVTLTGRG